MSGRYAGEWWFLREVKASVGKDRTAARKGGETTGDLNRLPRELLPARGWGWRDVSSVVRWSSARKARVGPTGGRVGELTGRRCLPADAGEGRRGTEELLFPQGPKPRNNQALVSSQEI